jgi:hypothetical protein
VLCCVYWFVVLGVLATGWGSWVVGSGLLVVVWVLVCGGVFWGVWAAGDMGTAVGFSAPTNMILRAHKHDTLRRQT